jgi:hypothetical protein
MQAFSYEKAGRKMLVKMTSNGRRRRKKASHGTKRGERKKVCEEKKRNL